MPVKVRCTGCSKVISAPDQARGKAVRCPSCQTAIRVPAAPARKKAPVAKATADEDFLRQIDISRVQHSSERVCPKCAAFVDAEDIDCPECGVNLVTGVLGEEQRRIRHRQGPDPGLFYSKVWGASWQFLTKNKSLAYRTALYWTILVWNAGFFGWRTLEATQRENVSAFGKALETGIWGSVSFLSFVGMFGWYWYLTVKVTQLGLERQKKIKDLHFDMGQCMALGVKAVVWPVVLMTPVLWAVAPIGAYLYFMGGLDLGGSSTANTVGIAFGCIALFPYLSFPAAMAHMSMPYTYKAWLPVDMVTLFFKNIGAVLYWWLVALACTWPVLLGLFLINYFLIDILDVVQPALESASMSIAGLMSNEVAKTDATYLTVWYSILIFGGSIITACIAIPMSFPAVFLARANALFTYYRSATLELVTHTKQGEIAGFWIRYLAFCSDVFILAVIFGLYWVMDTFVAFILVDMFGLEGMQYGFHILFVALGIFTHYRYFVRSEIGNSQGTFGKSSIGLIVTNMDGSKITLKTARMRWFLRTFVTPITFYMGYLMVLFTKDKQTLHDSMTKTKVTWEGDRE